MAIKDSVGSRKLHAIGVRAWLCGAVHTCGSPHTANHSRLHGTSVEISGVRVSGTRSAHEALECDERGARNSWDMDLKLRNWQGTSMQSWSYRHFDIFEFNTASPAEFVNECQKLCQPYRVLRRGEQWHNLTHVNSIKFTYSRRARG